jgi:ATP-dependent DNA ligase
MPVPLALALAVDDPRSGPTWSLEPKLDGWRCQIHTGAGRLWSRHDRELTRAFSDIAAAARALPDCVLDGELVAVLDTGQVSFARLQTRAGRGPRPDADFTVHFAAFDALSVGDTDWRGRRYSARRAEVLRLLADGPPQIRPVPATADLAEAMTWVGALGGVEGLVCKPDVPYRAGRAASGWLKWRQRHSTEALVIGVTRARPADQAFVLGRVLPDGRQRAVGVSLPVGEEIRRQAASLLRPDTAAFDGGPDLPQALDGLPGAPPVSYLPVIPEIVVDIESDQAGLEHGRYRHRPRVVRIRGDLTPRDLMRE